MPESNGASPSPAFPRGRSKKKTLWVVFFFFALAPPKGRGAQRSATKKKHFAHPGPTAKKTLETNDAGHEQKGATTKKNTLAYLGPLFSETPKSPARISARDKHPCGPEVDLPRRSKNSLGLRVQGFRGSGV